MKKIAFGIFIVSFCCSIFSLSYGANANNIQESQKIIGAEKLASGLYRTAGNEGEFADIILYSNGLGSFEIEEDSNPFTWKAQGSKLVINMLDASLPPEHRTYEGIIKNSNSFVLHNHAYQREKDIKIETYAYQEKDFTGNLYLTDWVRDDGKVNIKIATVNEELTTTCDAEVTCKTKGNLLLCKDVVSEEPDAILMVKVENKDILEVDGTFSRSEYCGNGGDFFGKYKLVP